MYQRLLVPVDGTELSAAAVAQSVALARQLGAAIVAFVAEPPMPLPNMTTTGVYAHERDAHDARTAQHAKEVLAQVEAIAKESNVVFEGLFVYATNIDEAIATAAVEHRCDMIVMATHGRGALGEMLFGSHTKGVISRTRIPVLVLH